MFVCFFFNGTATTEISTLSLHDALPIYMLGQLRRVITPEVNAIASVLLAVSVVMVTIFFFLNRKNK